jgi:hypothetical protein
MTAILRPSDEDVDKIATKLGPISDDLERSLRIGKLFGPLSIARVPQWSIVKDKKPGRYLSCGGGISAMFESGADFQESKAQQLAALATEFPGRIETVPDSDAGWSWGPARNQPYVVENA